MQGLGQAQQIQEIRKITRTYPLDIYLMMVHQLCFALCISPWQYSDEMEAK